MNAKWNVWSIDRKRERALVVDEGKQVYAEDSARRRNDSAERLGAENLEFVALPDGQEPF